jgi:hypothetical protein
MGGGGVSEGAELGREKKRGGGVGGVGAGQLSYFMHRSGSSKVIKLLYAFAPTA